MTTGSAYEPPPTLPRQLARTRRFTLGAPTQPTVSADGRTVLFLRSRAGDDPVGCLWALDAGTGAERLLADPAALGFPESPEGELPEAERIRRERARVHASGITAYATDGAGRLAAFALGGALWLADADTGEVRRVPTATEVYDPRPDPTGRWVAYAGGGALRVVRIDGDGVAPEDRAPAEPEHDEVRYGVPDHVAAESMHRTRAHWWSPDGTRLLVARVDERPLRRLHLADPSDPARPPRVIRYPLAGTANAEVTLWLLALDGTAPVEVRWDRAGFEYLTAAGWDGHGPYAAVQNRDQRTVRTLAIDPADGGTRTLADRHDEHWVQLVPGLPARTAAGALVDAADHGDTRHLTVDGEPVTPPGLQLREVLGTDGGSVLFTASAEPTETHLWSWDPDRGAVRLSSEPGVHTGVRRAGTLVHTARTPRAPGGGLTVHRAGDVHPVVSHAQAPVTATRPELLRLGPRDLRAALFLPTGHRPADGPLPVLLDPYGGPALTKVTAAGSWWDLVSQWFADQGFAVLAVDGRGTPGRGPRWEKAVFADVATPALEDQVDALQEAARLRPGLLDLDRVGIRGWSYGGFLAALAVLRRPDVFHAAVAGAAPTDHRLYDTHWKERFLGHPDEHPERYDACSLIPDAPGLRRPLLLVHGLADDNVLPAHSLRLSAALLAAGRPHELLPVVGAGHSPGDEVTAENLLLHQLDFLRRSLGLG